MDPHLLQKPCNFDLYDTFLVDLVGVMHDGKTYFPSAIERINGFKAQGKEIIFISNSPRPSFLSKKSLEENNLFLPVVTSGDYVRSLLETEYKNALLYHFGSAKNKDLLGNLNIKEVFSLKECDFVLLSLFAEEDEDLEAHMSFIKDILKMKKPVLCANPDRFALYGTSIRKCAGYFAALVKQQEGNVRFIGKPGVDFFTYAISNRCSDSFRHEKTLMIGDTKETDILGANRFGIDSLLLRTGIFGKGLSDHEDSFPTYVMDSL